MHFGFPSGLDGKEFACSVRDPSSIPGLGGSPGEENGNPLHYSCLENSMDFSCLENSEKAGGLQSMELQ